MNHHDRIMKTGELVIFGLSGIFVGKFGSEAGHSLIGWMGLGFGMFAFFGAFYLLFEGLWKN
jgi:hypothetical protein